MKGTIYKYANNAELKVLYHPKGSVNEPEEDRIELVFVSATNGTNAVKMTFVEALHTIHALTSAMDYLMDDIRTGKDIKMFTT